MVMQVAFPKDKEEIRKKKMEMLMKKIDANVEDVKATDDPLGGRDGERRLHEITQELRRYYKDNVGPKPVTKVVGQMTDRESRNDTGVWSSGGYGEHSLYGGSFDPVPDTASSQILQQHQTSSLSQALHQYSSMLMGPNINGLDETKGIDHVARNARLMSKYREVLGIKHQINQDIFYTRRHNTQQRAQMVDSEKRLKSMQWLKKWDVFRQTKNEYV